MEIRIQVLWDILLREVLKVVAKRLLHPPRSDLRAVVKQPPSKDLSDIFAKLATKLSSNKSATVPIYEYNFISLSTVKRYIKKQLEAAWLERAFDKNFKDDRAQLNDWIRNFIPNPNYINKKSLALCDQSTSQVTIGHGCFLEYFERVDLAVDNKCIKHPDKVDSPEHVLFECVEGYTKVMNKMGIYKKEDLWKILGNPKKSEENIEMFNDLCKTIITDRNTLINNCPKMKQTRVASNRKKLPKTGNTSK